MRPQAARAAAVRRFGNVTLMCERTRDRAAVRWVRETIDDARLALRLMRRHFGEVALSTSLPPRGDGAVGVLERERAPPPDPQHSIVNIAQQSISDRYFEVMRVHLGRGRPFGPADTGDALAVSIVNDALVRNYFGRSDPIGQRIRFAGVTGPNPWLTVRR